MHAATPHLFHIPVMGTGFTVDTPLRVAPFGISSQISLVDDLLLEKVRAHYCRVYNLEYEPILRNAEDGRAKRVKAYLDLMHDLVQKKFEELKSLPFFDNTAKDQYFEMLPDSNPLKAGYLRLKSLMGPEKEKLASELTEAMRPGTIDVNIMVKLDRIPRGKDNQPLPEFFSDAKAALRGFAESKVESSLVLSAGINQTLMTYASEFKSFYRNAVGDISKKIVLKVSDFRSAMIQGKFLAKKGLEVYEFQIESGLNCGGHAFASQGQLLPTLMEELRQKREQLAEQMEPLVRKFYEKMGWEYSEEQTQKPRLTVQGGIGNSGEQQRMIEYYGTDSTGWGTPFLLVPEATPVDEYTLEQLRVARKEDLYLSDASPLGVPFNNLRNSNSEVYMRERFDSGRPGSPCPKGFLVSNKEFGEVEICTASHTYQKQKFPLIDQMEPGQEREQVTNWIQAKQCICDHLANSALIALGEARQGAAPQAVCPGPNLAWFNELYSMRQMIDHIYGRIPSLVSDKRPHMFAAEIELYVDYFDRLIRKGESTFDYLKVFFQNLVEGMDLCLEIAKGPSFGDENLASIPEMVAEQRPRLEALWNAYQLEQTAVVAN